MRGSSEILKTGLERVVTPSCARGQTDPPACYRIDPMAGLLALIALAMFSGVRRGPQDLVEYAATLSQGGWSGSDCSGADAPNALECPPLPAAIRPSKRWP